MHRIREAPGAGRICFLALPRTSSGAFFGAFFAALLLAAGPVAARQCPRGQFLRVSKNTCVPKEQASGRHSEAIGGRTYYGPTFRGPTKQQDQSPEAEPEPAAAAYAPDAGPAEVDKPIAAISAKKSKASAPTGPSASPYGELSLESFPKP